MNTYDTYEILTIGHSTHAWDRFSALLRATGVTAIADVRSSPFSRHTPQFNKAELAHALKELDIAYVFLGKELGGRPTKDNLYWSGVADYEKIARTDNFRCGIDRLLQGASRYRIALMCAEKEPLDCHRCLLVARYLSDRSYSVGHILDDASIEPHTSSEERLLALEGLDAEDMFVTREQRIAQAYRKRSMKRAYSVVEQTAPSETVSG